MSRAKILCNRHAQIHKRAHTHKQKVFLYLATWKALSCSTYDKKTTLSCFRLSILSWQTYCLIKSDSRNRKCNLSWCINLALTCFSLFIFMYHVLKVDTVSSVHGADTQPKTTNTVILLVSFVVLRCICSERYHLFKAVHLAAEFFFYLRARFRCCRLCAVQDPPDAPGWSFSWLYTTAVKRK